jgi:hypothetical protein
MMVPPITIVVMIAVVIFMMTLIGFGPVGFLALPVAEFVLCLPVEPVFVRWIILRPVPLIGFSISGSNLLAH